MTDSDKENQTDIDELSSDDTPENLNEETDAPEAEVQPEPEEETTPPTLEEEVAQWRDTALRRQADLENFRKRVERERMETIRFANGSLLEELLPILDNFDMGLEAARSESSDSMIFKGMEMVNKQLGDFLEGRGVKVVDTEGQAFDPSLHDAVSQEETTEVPDGQILRVTRRGYELHDRLLRPASVVVAKAPGSGDSEATPESHSS